MKIVFFGSSKHSLIGAKIIHQASPLACIVTLPDKPDKRGRLTSNPLKDFAKEKNIPYITTDKLTAEKIYEIGVFQPDFLIVEDYGLILPRKLLDLPKYASLNIHHSLLPKYRGPAPAPATILAGDTIGGVSIITMAEKVDAGAILAQKTYELKPDETTDSLLTILNKIGAEMLIPLLSKYKDGTVKPIIQDESKATHTKQFTRQDGFIDLMNPPSPEELDRMIRAYHFWPTVWTKTEINGKEKILKFLPSPTSLRATGANDEAISSRYLIQVEGKNPIPLKDFLNGYPEMREKILKLF